MLLPTASVGGESHFLTVSEQKWQIKGSYSFGGKDVGLYGLVGNVSVVVNKGSNHLQQFEPMGI